MVLHEPFQVPYGVLVPKNIDGLLVPVACSCSHVAYNALRMEPVFMALGEASGIAAHLALTRRIPVRKVPVPVLQKILTERRGVITFYEDLNFDDPAFAAFQWLGARGLNKGYAASPDARLSRSAAWESLSRILSIEGKPWRPPIDNPDAPLLRNALAAELQKAGYSVSGDAAQPVGPVERLTLRQFASIVYRAVSPESAGN